MPYGMGLTARQNRITDRDKEVLCPLEGKTSLLWLKPRGRRVGLAIPLPRSDIVSKDHSNSVTVCQLGASSYSQQSSPYIHPTLAPANARPGPKSAVAMLSIE